LLALFFRRYNCTDSRGGERTNQEFTFRAGNELIHSFSGVKFMKIVGGAAAIEDTGQRGELDDMVKRGDASELDDLRVIRERYLLLWTFGRIELR
jgi:hypothetical protein